VITNTTEMILTRPVHGSIPPNQLKNYHLVGRKTYALTTIFDPGLEIPMAVTSVLSSLRFPAETCLDGSRQTPLPAGGDESGKGQDSSLSLTAKYWSVGEIQVRRSNRPESVA
jgi:hypothetical protein